MGTAVTLIALLLAAAGATGEPGALDPSFGNGGRLVGVGDSVSNLGLAVTADGRVLVGDGRAIYGQPGTSRLTRYRADGTIDQSLKPLSLPSSAGGVAAGPVLQADGKIVLGTLTVVNGSGVGHVVRLLSDGSLDATFGQGGVASTSLDDVTGVAVEPDGTIIVGGAISIQTTKRAAVFALTAEGSTRPNFGQSGLAVAPGSGTVAEQLAVDHTGRVLVDAYDPAGSRLFRFGPDGTLDASFAAGSGLEVEAPFAVDGADRPLTFGSQGLLRFDPTGAPDPTFGINGTAPFPNHCLNSGIGAPSYVLPLDNGDVIVGSDIVDGFLLEAFQPDGSVDTAFGIGGAVSTTFRDLLPAITYRINALAAGPHGTVVAAGVAITAVVIDGGFQSGSQILARYQTQPGSPGTTSNPVGGCPGSGYWLAASDGGIFSFGMAGYFGSTGAHRLTSPISTMVATQSGVGYWLVARDGGVFTFGDAPFYGSAAGRAAAPIIGMTLVNQPPDRPFGYQLVDASGNLFGFGRQCTQLGSGWFCGAPASDSHPLAGIALAAPLVGVSGPYAVATDGGVFTLSPTTFFGSTGGVHLNQPIVAIAQTPTPSFSGSPGAPAPATNGQGYWLIGRDGGVFSFGDARFFGSLGGIHLNQPIVGIVPTPTGLGYWLIASDGGVFSFGDAPFFGSTGSIHLNQPIIGAAVR